MALISPAPPLETAQRFIAVVPVDPTSDPRWLDFIARHPHATVYHHPAWLQVLVSEYRRRAVCLAAVGADGRFQGVLPLLETRGLPFGRHGSPGRRLSSLPRTPVAGPLSQDQQVTAALVRAAIDWLEIRPRMRLELRLSFPSCDGLVPGLVATPWLPSYRLELPADPARLRFGDSRNHARIKWALGRASRQGVRVRPAESIEDLRRWYPLYLRTMQSHAAPTRSRRFFEAAWEQLRPRGLMRLLLAEQPDAGAPRLLAGSVFLMFGPTVFYAFNGCSEQGRRVRANDVIQFQAINDACGAGFHSYDLGEVVESQDGLHEFKQKWGATAYRLYRYAYPSTGARSTTSPGAPGIHIRLAKTAWRRLPRRVAAGISDRLYGYL